MARFLVKLIYPYTKLSHDLAEIDCVKVFRETISKKKIKLNDYRAVMISMPFEVERNMHCNLSL